MAFQKSSGFKNTYDHLGTCYESTAEIKQDVIRNRISPALTLEPQCMATERKIAMYSYLKLVVMRNTPICSVEDKVYRDFSKYAAGFSRRYFTFILYALVELVENKFMKEMQLTRGSIQHDGWTSKGAHYLRLFAVYMRWAPDENENEVVSPLISMSTMSKVCHRESNNCTCTAETKRFDTIAHAEHIRKIFNLFSIDSDEWILRQTADNCNLNKAVARELKIPHIGCSSHELNLEAEEMVAADTRLKDCIESVHTTMVHCKSRIKNRAMLRNLTALSPIIEGKTCWSGKYLMLSRFVRIYDSIRSVAENEHPEVAMDMTSEYKSKVSSFAHILGQIDGVTRYLQNKHLSLSSCWLALNTLTRAVQTTRTLASSSLYRCRLGSNGIPLQNAQLCPNKARRFARFCARLIDQPPAPALVLADAAAEDEAAGVVGLGVGALDPPVHQAEVALPAAFTAFS